MSSLQAVKLRTVDVARRAGCSVQQVRNLERDGVLPKVARTAKGYRVYAEIHVRSVLAYQALAAGAGPIDAKKIMRTLQQRALSRAFALLDSVHARLAAERADICQARRAVSLISEESIGDIRASDYMGVSELADALGIRPSTLRHWHAQELVIPDRAAEQSARRYAPNQVRDARIVHQLRKAGYGITSLRMLMPGLRHAHRSEEVLSALNSREAAINRRSRALVDGAAALSAVIALIAGSDTELTSRALGKPQ
ncbi:MAG: MerR family transcriptional regulator [Corynebacteriales bacterium]|nr:MerR family transcriptional regulator [Mycobacteriales bacterium]